MLISAALGTLVLLAVTDILNYIGSSKKNTEVSQQFALWKSTIAGLLRNSNQCTAALSGQTLYTTGYIASNPTCNAGETNVISWPAACSNAGFYSSATCTGTWTAKTFLQVPATSMGVGLEPTQVCIKQNGATALGNGDTYGNTAVNALIILSAHNSSATGSTQTMSAYFPTILTVNSANVIQSCSTSHDLWETMSTTGAPLDREGAGALWIGSKAIIFGGGAVSWFYNSDSTASQDGGIYDPVADSWTAISNATMDYYEFDYGLSNGMAWTGSLALIWDGLEGTRYDPVAGTWTAMTALNAPVPSAGNLEQYRKSVWTGTHFITWGGRYTAFGTPHWTNGGGQYEPVLDKWTTMTTVNAPSARTDASVVWTGSQMWVWGGTTEYWDTGADDLGDGALYTPGTGGGSGDSWTTLTSPGAFLTARSAAAAVWTGSQVLVFGGGCTPGNCNAGTNYMTLGGGSYFNCPGNCTAPNGAIWTPNGGGGTWSAMEMTNAPDSQLIGEAAVWTGSEFLIFGGQDTAFGGPILNTGGRYSPTRPAGSAWAATTTLNAPTLKSHPAYVWTGSQLIVWGGTYQHINAGAGTGAKYTPPH